ncbi:probable calcium-binding protein CML44 [Impatiens glandulifera]|uniref:probable calcium-binding protein CML44 n=1 Tax=Impatiens glandulifera TaxID=253017 RepID=UPI001FB15422|nr:probable calcium-binding protein CML44 [Impatiens glandulifera]
MTLPVIITSDLHIIFEKLDRNGDGWVSLEALCYLFHEIGLSTTQDELEPLVDGKTRLDLIDFVCFYDNIINTISTDEEKEVVEAFKVFDLDGDGHITAEELKRVLKKLGMWTEDCGTDCDTMIQAYDSNSDGVLDFQEFKNMLMFTNSNPNPNYKL